MNQLEQRYAGNVGVVPYGAYADGDYADANTCYTYLQFLDSAGKVITDKCAVTVALYDSTGATVEPLLGGVGVTAFAIVNARGQFVNTLTAATDSCITTALSAQVTTIDSTPTNANAALAITATDDQAETLVLKVFNCFGNCIYQCEFVYS